MSDYPSMRNIDLQALLKNRRLPHTGNKATLIKRLYDDDALERLFRPLQNPDEDCYELRKFVHRENLLKITAQLQKGMFSTAKKTSILKDLKDGQCHELSCCLCGIGKLSKATENLFGRGFRCEDGTCANLMKCHKCRSGLEEPNEAYLRREQDSCTDASCGSLSRVPGYFPAPFNPVREMGHKTELMFRVVELRRCVHNRYLRKLILKLRNESPGPTEWKFIKQKLLNGQCLGLACSFCAFKPLAESMKTLSDGPDVDCGGEILASCKDQNKCPSCRQTLQGIADKFSRGCYGYCKENLHCGLTTMCSECRDRLQTFGGTQQAAKDSLAEEIVDMEGHCLNGDCGSINPCGACQWEQYAQKLKRNGRGGWHENKKHNRLETTDRRAGPLSALSSNASYDSVERPRHGIIDAMIGPRMRNEDLRRRRASKILTGYTESYEGPASSGTRKRRFSNLGLEYPLPSRHPLAQCIRDEEKREELERARAQKHHERPSWFGTQEDPLPDFWMGRPILSEKEISILKCLPSIPKYYLSESEDNDILLPEGAKEKRLCTVIRRLEAELMSRDFWMQSLGYNAADAFGKFPSGHYVVAGTDSLS
ncbi:hypothetical protein D6C92_03326 [Aureobasidium pullulans]|nr:hypothetical protein D6D04_00028 [Aureobasidium pullulans]THY97579.1 hypothetical protein D6C92_03326 [Aureobasidium pullulans]